MIRIQAHSNQNLFELNFSKAFIRVPMFSNQFEPIRIKILFEQARTRSIRTREKPLEHVRTHLHLNTSEQKLFQKHQNFSKRQNGSKLTKKFSVMTFNHFRLKIDLKTVLFKKYDLCLTNNLVPFECFLVADFRISTRTSTYECYYLIH